MSEPPKTSRTPEPRPAGAWVSIDERVPSPAAPAGMSPARRRALAIAIVEAAVFVSGMVFGMLVRGGGKGEKAAAPPPPPAAAPAAEVAPPPTPERSGTALRALEEARTWALEHPEDIKGQIERFSRVAREWDRTPAAEKARREAEEGPARGGARLLDELVALEEEVAGLEAREEFRDALAVYERSRGRHADPLWGQALDAKIGDLNRRIEGVYLTLKSAAEKASADRNDAELGKIRERIELWGLEDYARGFDRAFAGAAAAAVPVTAERKSYLDLWGKAAALAAARDYDAAVAVVKRYSGSLSSEDLRLEAGLDLEDVRRVAALYDDLRQALAAWPAGGGVSLETADGRKVAGSVWRSDRDRFEVQTGPGRETAFVEYSEVPAPALLGLFAGRSRAAPRDGRAAVLFCLFDGNLDAAKAAAGGKAEALPGKYWAFAREARAKAAKPEGVALKNEQQARSIYYAAEREYRDPRTRSAAVEKYRGLLRDYGDTGTVLRAVERVTRRAEPRPDAYYAARDLHAGGTFRARRQAAKGICWVTEEEADFASARENYVEIEFQAAADSQPRCWFLAGGCCAESFVAFYQASGLTSIRPKSKETVPVEPGSIYGVTLAVPDGARKKHASHGTAEAAAEPLQWEWIEAPLPKYAAEGIKRVRLMTGRRGLWVARAVVSTTRKAPPREDEARDLEESRAADLGFDPGADPDLVGAWSFDEGSGKVAGDASGGGRMGVAAGDPLWVDGKPGTAIFFDGKDDFVLVQDDPKLRLAGDLTLSFRVCYEAESKVRHRLAGKGEENYGVWGFTGNKLLLRQAGADGKPVLEVVSKKAMTPGEWHHVTAVVRGNRGFIYIDGVEDSAADRTGAPALSTAPFSLAHAGREGFFFGRLDEVRLWGRALSPEEIRALAEEPVK